ncbi:MAG: hypothetical protein COT92_01520 [Candidatus Doudnabacteria bacterium CG10_big_fil_rev_8_21_14_0_10_42_18]|uniref:Transcriptional repressor PaaX-like central Cas2-like domain-containing protein n=1 Tax=Candidatus Doudnabacteria bacterium CG10_big_fil_rev_8_21_14_0_10_42_18 TaxID=1974552 RepID=A0A2H0VB90_9BACT|nr:MAG: hypothetical protein COT92_01520 [Candidatus Doudnabacteria bacterium CG10_big_fil_rev_8_21_14_0_10_42_18]
MSRPYHPLTIDILTELSSAGELPFSKIYKALAKNLKYKEFYNAMYRLEAADLIKKIKSEGQLIAAITEEGNRLLMRKKPKKDGVWKLVIFDIPEKHKKVRNILRAKLKQLQFKKWQNSIWVSPYALDSEIEEELDELGKRYFVRLIKTTEINNTENLEKLFG